MSRIACALVVVMSVAMAVPAPGQDRGGGAGPAQSTGAAQFLASGWTRKRSLEMLKAGTPITVTVAPARAGGTVVLMVRILNEKGEELLGAAPPPGAAPLPVP